MITIIIGSAAAGLVLLEWFTVQYKKGLWISSLKEQRDSEFSEVRLDILLNFVFTKT